MLNFRWLCQFLQIPFFATTKHTQTTFYSIKWNDFTHMPVERAVLVHRYMIVWILAPIWSHFHLQSKNSVHKIKKMMFHFIVALSAQDAHTCLKCRNNLSLIHTDRFVNFATKTYSTPSECCCTSNVSSTLSRMFPFFANKSDVPFKYSMSSR